jgi:anti-sigma regulatory factor (Ser/Thr protein kinase)
VDAALVEITVHDDWTARLRGDATLAIEKCFAERPTAVIVDLTRMADPRSTSVATWMAAARKGGSLEPPVHLVLCLPATTPLAARLRRLGAHLYLPMFDTMPQAREAVSTRLPLTDALRLRLSAGPAAASVARDLVGDACQAWDLMHLLHAGRAVLSELVANAFEHAGNEIQVSLSRRGTGLHIAVRDNSRQLPGMVDLAPVVAGRPLDDRGQGLHIVHASAAMWGAMATKDGKVVWATVRPRGSRPHG